MTTIEFDMSEGAVRINGRIDNREDLSALARVVAEMANELPFKSEAVAPVADTDGVFPWITRPLDLSLPKYPDCVRDHLRVDVKNDDGKVYRDLMARAIIWDSVVAWMPREGNGWKIYAGDAWKREGEFNEMVTVIGRDGVIITIKAGDLEKTPGPFAYLEHGGTQR